MRKTYKNKRDQYKAEAEQNGIKAERDEAEAQRLRNELNKKAEEAKKRYSATVYCSNCLQVTNIEVAPGVRIDEGDCVVCRVRNRLSLVISYLGKI